MAETLAVLLAAALAVAPVPSASPTTRTTEPVEPAVSNPDPAVPDPAVPDPAAPATRDPAPEVMEGPRPAPTPNTMPAGLCHGSRPCKRLVVLASVTGGLGLTSMIIGSVLAARPQRIDPEDPTMAIAYRPAGSAALAIGLGVLATSLLMTLAAIRASRHAKKTALSARLKTSAAR